MEKMNIETKTVRGNVENYKLFGWENTGETRVKRGRLHHTEYILARDKELNNYSELVRLENEYFSLKSQLQTYTPMDAVTCFLGFICFIIPGIIYVSYKTNQQKQIESFNENIKRQMDEVVVQAQSLKS